MNPFISISEFSKQSPESVNLILCISTKDQTSEYIESSILYTIDEDIQEFILKARGLELDEDKPIIIYDKGDLKVSSKAYWGFRATGHDDVRILLGGLKACEDFGVDLQSGSPPPIDITEPFLPFNTSVIIPYADFIKKESYYQQVSYADKLAFDIFDVRGNIIPEQQLTKNLESAGITVNINKATMVHGPSAAIVAVLLKYLGQRSVSVVLESTEGFVSSKKINKNNAAATATDPGTGSSKRSLPFVDPVTVEKPKHKVIEDQTRCNCNCTCF